jgi:hypothetical protein
VADTTPTFEIGLTMAGAVSAGAYSAGVLDFLCQALDAWEQEKRRDPDAVPNHNVCIKVITGASAGSITGALGAAALAGGLQPTPSAQAPLYTVPALYKAWVELPDLAPPSGAPGLLDTTDLTGTGGVNSLLNGSVLDTIGEIALRTIGNSSLPNPTFGPLHGGSPVPYIAKNLHLYMTISNLRGIPYKISFGNAGDIGGYGMLNHGDRTHFVLTGIGDAERRSDWADGDPGDTIAVSSLPKNGAPLLKEWRDFLQAALASSAFPLGLVSRRIDSGMLKYDGRMWPFPHAPSHAINPQWPMDWLKTPAEPREFSFINVDGGLINNEPFEYAHFALMEPGVQAATGLVTAPAAALVTDQAGDVRQGVVAGQNTLLANPRSATDADRAVIMIDPFPEDPAFQLDDNVALDSSLIAVIKGILPTVMAQARFKPNELALALDETVYSRFLIAPRRAGANDVPMKHAIATGLLGGFGGFIDVKLRAFDYQLGRRNCQKFLRDGFVLDSGNAIVAAWSDRAKGNPAFLRGNGDKKFCTIIPLVGSAAPAVSLPEWPKLGDARVRFIVEKAVARAAVLVPRLVEQQTTNVWLRMGAKLLWSVFGAGAVRQYAYLSIQQNLILRDQHADWALRSDDERAVFAALSDPGYDYRTIPGLAKSTYIAPDKIAGILSNDAERLYSPDHAAPNGLPAYTLASRKPSWFARTVGNWFKKPSYG